jgi:hypothetical protein
MRHSAIKRDAEFFARQHRCRAGEARDVARPRRHQSGFGAVRAPHAEVDQQLSGRGEHAARRFGGDQRLKMQDVDQPRLDELRLRQRRGHAQDRLVGEKHGAFGHGVHVAAKTQRGEIVEKLLAETAGAFQPRYVGVGKMQRFQEIQRLRQARSEQEPATRRQGAGEEFEHRRIGIAMIQIGLNHGELIKVRQERAGVFHRGGLRELGSICRKYRITRT